MTGSVNGKADAPISHIQINQFEQKGQEKCLTRNSCLPGISVE